jgi:hypothetical protein
MAMILVISAALLVSVFQTTDEDEAPKRSITPTRLQASADPLGPAVVLNQRASSPEISRTLSFLAVLSLKCNRPHARLTLYRQSRLCSHNMLSKKHTREAAMEALDSMKDGTHWRERAKEARMTADACNHPDEKQMMLDIARSYDRLAETAEKRFAEDKATRVVG